jgi:hypothetical protein
MVYRQDFFFEKKKQKTFIFFRRLHFAGPTLESGAWISPLAQDINGSWFFSSEKNMLPA